MSRKQVVSATVARERLKELQQFYGSIVAMQHNLFVSTGLRIDRTRFYKWLGGIACPDGRVTRLAPPTRHLVNRWIEGHEGIVPSKNKEQFKEQDWWTPVQQSRKLKDLPNE